MPRYIATIELLLEANDDLDAADGVAEMLRPMMKPYADKPKDTCLVDWQYTDDLVKSIREVKGTDLKCFEYGDWTDD